MTGKPDDASREGAQMSFEGRMSYSDYLHLERVLDAQEPLSDAHDELLFIIQHQTSELWMKLAIHELRSAIKAIRHDQLQPAFKMLSRIARIFEQLNTAWDVLRTMTPSEYTEFRDQLGQSSGFQSYQYRAIEFLAGNRNLALLGPHAHRADITAKLEEILAEPGLYDEALLLWRAMALTSAKTRAEPTGASSARQTTRFWRPGRPSMRRRRNTGCSTSLRKSWSISRTISAAGASTTSRRSSASSA